MVPTFPVLRPAQEDSWDCQERGWSSPHDGRAHRGSEQPRGSFGATQKSAHPLQPGKRQEVGGAVAPSYIPASRQVALDTY